MIFSQNHPFLRAIMTALLALGVLMMLRFEPAHSAKMPFLMGVNLAGAEFGDTMPGEHGTDYVYPSSQDILRYKKMGFNVIRLPFRWERLQPDIFGTFNQKEWQHIAGLAQTAQKNGVYLILDVHNYARRKLRKDGFGKEHVIGSKALPVKAFSQFWQELARRSQGWPNVIFGLMNEPYDMPAKDWLNIAQQTLNVIRATGAKNLVLLPGVAWSGAHSWMDKKINNVVMADIIDPKHNIAIEVHQYFDQDSSGSHPKAVSKTIGSERLKAFQNWARQHKFKAFLGEFGSGSDATSLAAIKDILAELARNKDIWLGWTAWAAGPWWPDDDKFTLERSSKGKARKQTRLLSQIAKAR